MSQCEKYVSPQEGWIESICVWEGVHDLSKDVKSPEFMSASVCALTFVYMCLPVCVCAREFQTVKLSWGTSAAAVILRSEMENFSQHLHNISSQQKKKKKKRKEDTGLKLSSGRAHGFHFIGLFSPWYAWSSWGNLKRSQNVIHLLKIFKS